MSAKNLAIKPPNMPMVYTKSQIEELKKCKNDPIYFMTTFMKVQHATSGAIPFKPWPFQVDIINAFHKHRFNIVLAARQMGKCVTFNTKVTHNESLIPIGSLVKLSFKERIVNWLEQRLLKNR